MNTTENNTSNSFLRNLALNFEVESACMNGAYADFTWKHDPKHMLFSMARYKFCAKMLDGANLLLEIGCGDSFCSPILLQSVKRMVGIDVIPELIESNRCRGKNAYGTERVSYVCHNIITSPLERKYDAAVSLDVLEHIPAEREDGFVRNIAASLTANAVCIFGTPNITASPYAGEGSVKEHVNLKSAPALKDLLSRYFHNVFIFSMNDEVVHTGFHPMAHYLMAMAVAPGVDASQEIHHR